MIEDVKKKLAELKIKFEEKNNKVIIYNFDTQLRENHIEACDIVIFEDKTNYILITLVEKKTKVKIRKKLDEHVSKAKRQIVSAAEWINSKINLNPNKERFLPYVVLPFSKKQSERVTIKGRPIEIAPISEKFLNKIIYND